MCIVVCLSFGQGIDVQIFDEIKVVELDECVAKGEVVTICDFVLLIREKRVLNERALIPELQMWASDQFQEVLHCQLFISLQILLDDGICLSFKALLDGLKLSEIYVCIIRGKFNGEFVESLHQIILIIFQSACLHVFQLQIKEKPKFCNRQQTYVLKLVDLYYYQLTEEKNIISNMLPKHQNSKVVFLEDDPQATTCRNSQILMDLDVQEQIEEQKYYESERIDQLLQTSFVELDKITNRESFQQTNFNFNTGESFFLKTNQLYHSQFPSKLCKRMKNKKMQCDIGSGVVYESISSSMVLYEKIRRLQILKMVKLVKLIFKNVRSYKTKIKMDMQKLITEHKQAFEKIGEEMNKLSSKFCEEIGMKDMRIMELESQLSQISKMNSWLSHKLQQNHQASQRLIEEINLQKSKSLAQIQNVSMTASLKAQEIQEQNESLQHQNQYFQQQIQNLQYLCNNHQISIKKLEYQNEKLEKQNSSLSLRLQQLSKQIHQRQLHFNQLNSQCLSSNDEISKLMKLNELYQRQLESTKKQILKLEQINVQITKQTQQIIMTQLNRYQECFNQEIAKIKKQHISEIIQKNTIIQQLKQKQEKITHSKTINHNKISKNNKIFKKVDANKKVFKEQGEYIQKNELQLHKHKVKSIGYLSKNSQIKNQNKQPDIVFKAKQHTAQLKVKLADYLRQKQERVLFASDGMLKTYIQLNKNKNNKLDQQQDKQSLRSYRK